MNETAAVVHFPRSAPGPPLAWRGCQDPGLLDDTGRLAGGTQNGDEPATLAAIERKIGATRKRLE
jgi:hypothetical protein